MWKVGLAFVGHRLLIFIAALFFINSALSSAPGASFMPVLASYSTLQTRFLSKVAEGPDVATLIGRLRRQGVSDGSGAGDSEYSVRYA